MYLLRTFKSLNDARDFQTIASTARSILELCIDIHLLCTPGLISNATEKFHAFTRAASLKSAVKRVQFYDAHPELEKDSARTGYRELAGNQAVVGEVAKLCLRLWNRAVVPEHWSGLRWSKQIELMPLDLQERYVRWHQMLAWNVHGGAAATGGMTDRVIFRSIESVSRELVRDALPALKLVGVKMHLHRVKADFFERLDFVVTMVETLAVIDAKRVALGYPSKFGIELAKSDQESRTT